MGLIRLPGLAYGSFYTAMRFPGSETFSGMQDEVVPVQDLNRALQDALVEHILYVKNIAPAATETLAMGWADRSTWDSVLINGILVDLSTGDAQLPDAADDRFIVSAGYEITANGGDYTSAELTRTLPVGAATRMQMVEWGAVVASHVSPNVVSYLLPQRLTPREDTVRVTNVVSGSTLTAELSIQMMAAPPGVLAAYLGS